MKLGATLPIVRSLLDAPDAMRILALLKPQVLIVQQAPSPVDLQTMAAHGIEEIWVRGDLTIDTIKTARAYGIRGSREPAHMIVPLVAWWDGEGNGGLRDPKWGGRPTQARLDYPKKTLSIEISDLGLTAKVETLNLQKSEEDQHDRRIVVDNRPEWMAVLAGLASASDPEVLFVGELPHPGVEVSLDEPTVFAIKLWVEQTATGIGEPAE